jgi:hypothetical protein
VGCTSFDKTGGQTGFGILGWMDGVNHLLAAPSAPSMDVIIMNAHTAADLLKRSHSSRLLVEAFWWGRTSSCRMQPQTTSHSRVPASQPEANKSGSQYQCQRARTAQADNWINHPRNNGNFCPTCTQNKSEGEQQLSTVIKQCLGFSYHKKMK